MFKKLILLCLAVAVILGCGLFRRITQIPTEPSQEIENPSDVPQSGDLLYETTFNDFSKWEIATFGNMDEYFYEARSNGLYVKVPDKNDYWFAYYDFGKGNSDVRIEMDAELVGDNNYTYISIVCRSSEKGEYIFTLDTGGYWQIGKYNYKKDEYDQLDYGESTRIEVGKHPNHITAICEGNELTLKINDYDITSVRDAQFTDGEIGIGVETFDYPLTEVIFHKLEVYTP